MKKVSLSNYYDTVGITRIFPNFRHIDKRMCYLLYPSCGFCSSRGMNVSISSIWADSSMRILSYLKPMSTSSFLFSAAWVQVMAMIFASFTSRYLLLSSPLRSSSNARNSSSWVKIFSIYLWGKNEHMYIQSMSGMEKGKKKSLYFLLLFYLKVNSSYFRCSTYVLDNMIGDNGHNVSQTPI